MKKKTKITRRYAEFIVSVLYLSGFSEFSGDISLNKKLNTCSTKLREEIEKVLIRMAEAKHKDWRSKTIFLMNNYDLILSVFAVIINFGKNLNSTLIFFLGKRYFFFRFCSISKIVRY